VTAGRRRAHTRVMNGPRTAALLTWIYAACFGLPAVPVAVYVADRGTLPWLADLFPMYGGPWWDRFGQQTFLVLLGAFAVTLALACLVARSVWRGRRPAAWVALLLIPVEAVFWYGFALPVPWLIGAARAALLVAALRATRAPARVRP
jgi:hypothetical protein